MSHQSRLLAAVVLLTSLFVTPPASSQTPAGMSPGEAFATRFSGISGSAPATIDLDGTVGSIVDLRNPSQPALGQHWLNEPQRAAVRARDVGQVFGVALDEANPPNVYLTATAAFGLHRTSDNRNWMPGMWGAGGGPGTIYKLTAADGYRPRVFATVTLDGRQNSGAALGNISFDRWHNQLLVSDLETGMIHRFDVGTGQELGRYDHGQQGRTRFFDTEKGAQRAVPAVAFDPRSAANIDNCSDAFARTPACWNVADFRRRVWGLNVRKDSGTGEVRLYYAVWSSNGLGNAAFAGAEDEEKRNTIWSVALLDTGDFDPSRVTREFALPDFFSDPGDIAQHGRSHPVSDIAFPRCGEPNSMLVSERGGLRNLGIGTSRAPFASPHQSRVLRYRNESDDSWTLAGRYDVGFYDRRGQKEPRIRANAAGGADFGYGYGRQGNIDTTTPDRTVWMTGDALCSPTGACFNPTTNKRTDGSQVHGAQGTPTSLLADLDPTTATAPGVTPASSPAEAYPPVGPRQSYMVDLDPNVDASGRPLMPGLMRDDATMIGDIAIYQACGLDAPVAKPEPPVPATTPTITTTDAGSTITTDAPVDRPDLEKRKTGPAVCIAGDVCTFTVTVANVGTGTWSGPLFELDTLPPGATLATYLPQPEWTCVQAGDAVNCEHASITLAPGASVTLTMDVILPPDVSGPATNCIEDVWAPNGPDDAMETILAIERRLSALGYDPGPVDGILDDATAAAISNYQAAMGLDVDGAITDTLRDALFPEDAGLPGDANPLNDRACHTVQVELPQPLGPVPDPLTFVPQPPEPVMPIADPIETFIPLPPRCPPGTWRRGDQCISIIDVITTTTIRLCPPPLVRRHGQCECPNGTVPVHGRCLPIISTGCEPPTVLHHGRCVCPDGMRLHHGRCETPQRSCPSPLVRFGDRCVCPDGRSPHHGRCDVQVICKAPLVNRGGQCVCPSGSAPHHGQCTQTIVCRAPMVRQGDRCACPAGTTQSSGRCLPQTCRPPLVLRHGACVQPGPTSCPAGQTLRAGHCVPVAVVCPAGQVMRNGRCVMSGSLTCPPGTAMRHGQCVKTALPPCPPNTHRVGNACVPTKVTPQPCPPNTHRVGNACVPTKVTPQPCPPNTHRVGNACVPTKVTPQPCPPNTHRVGNACVPTKVAPQPCPPNTHRVGNACVPTKVTPQPCPPNTHRVGNACVPTKVTPQPCPPNTHRVGNACVPTKVTPQPCPPNTHRVGNACVPTKVTPQACPAGTYRQGASCVKIKREPPKPTVKLPPPKPTVRTPPKPQVKVVPRPQVKVAPKPQVKVAPKPPARPAVSCPAGTYRQGNACVPIKRR